MVVNSNTQPDKGCGIFKRGFNTPCINTEKKLRQDDKDENNTHTSGSLVDSNLENLGNSVHSGFNLDCSKNEAACEYNRTFVPENVTCEE